MRTTPRSKIRRAGWTGETDRFIAFGDYAPLLAIPAAPFPAEPRVVFAGVLEDYKGVDVLLDASSLLVLPSRSEGLGRVIVEAHARGRPVVASRVGGIAELVDHGATGLLVPPDEYAALAAALIVLLREPYYQELLGAEGRRRIAARNPQAEFEAGLARLARRLTADGQRGPA